MNRREQSRLGGELLRERPAGRARLLGCGGIDDGKNFLMISLKGGNKRKLSLAPGQVGRD